MNGSLRRAGLAIALAALCACQSQPVQGSAVWNHLAAKYDADGDQRLSPGECGRAGEDFTRLDADGDGALTPADFPDENFARDLGIERIPPQVRAHLRAVYDARAVVLAYFPHDPADGGLSREALVAAFEWLDLDFSAALDTSEFALATEQRPWAGPGEAWELLLAAMDRPGEGQETLALEEFEGYHGELCDDDGILRGPSAGAPAANQDVASDGPPLGTPAPDFALAPPDGGTPVRLSSSLGRPVALIFGSWT